MEQRSQYGIKSPRTVIAITPTYVRTFQTLHLTGVMHSLMNVPYDLVWIVDRHKLESSMRLHALRIFLKIHRIVREKRLDGIVMFADDSNMHSLELFDEIQNVKWLGAVSVGILAHVGGPACNSSNQLVGWHVFDTLPFVETSARYIGDRAVVLPRKLEWAGFVLNSRLVWEETGDKPVWVKEWEEVDRDGEDLESPLSLVKDTSVVEPLGSCGRKVLLWWLRVEARADSKFPARFVFFLLIRNLNVLWLFLSVIVQLCLICQSNG
ncbi:probable beta-1 4-xylosyltransferase irx14h [Phtheirospermum japonicum]|uniref:Glycosyltransferases n=1 Tax=Phtheirospermum japonicum TaxID=374723 RepID=A0A830CQK3_9LAMI|nr:probable beta-1 4-xylosyltransferase irx14h [Phtheirospermum japonicum]